MGIAAWALGETPLRATDSSKIYLSWWSKCTCGPISATKYSKEKKGEDCHLVGLQSTTVTLWLSPPFFIQFFFSTVQKYPLNFAALHVCQKFQLCVLTVCKGQVLTGFYVLNTCSRNSIGRGPYFFPVVSFVPPQSPFLNPQLLQQPPCPIPSASSLWRTSTNHREGSSEEGLGKHFQN